MADDKITNIVPAQRFQNGRDVFGNPRSGDDSGSKVNNLLHLMYMTASGPAPDGEAVEDVWENVTLDEEFTGFGGEVVTNFI